MFGLDASASSTITDVDLNGTIEQWSDKSGNNRHATQGMEGFRPLYDASAFDVRGGINFDHIDDYL
ncbi:hypothetical protein [Curvivirga aplysinae]|uniref:hypothetical protein n=1 Tax=Curvivirga aplysinae TaxID=2529852 RepID=UPI0012BC2425|nr:hypothetical protein [Curvivirga aplysinae]MTI08203.1 hypothetical protein [Curvivirga aplysinae]